MFRQIPTAIVAKGVVAEDVVVTAEAEVEEAVKAAMNVEEAVVMDEDVVVAEVDVKGAAVVEEEVPRVAGPRASMSRMRTRSLHCRIARLAFSITTEYEVLCFAIRHSVCTSFGFQSFHVYHFEKPLYSQNDGFKLQGEQRNNMTTTTHVRLEGLVT